MNRTLRPCRTALAVVIALVGAAGGPAGADTLVFPHILETQGTIESGPAKFDTQFHLATTAGYVGDCAGGGGRSIVDLYLFHPDGTPVRSATDETVCNPCSFPMGSDVLASYQAIDVEDLIFAAGGFPSQAPDMFALFDVPDGAGIGVTGFTLYSRSSAAEIETSALSPVPLGAPVPSPSCGRQFVLPRIFSTGTALDPNSWDTIIDMTYAGGLLTAAGDSSRVDLWIFDESTGAPLAGPGGPLCAPCTFPMGPDLRHHQARLGELAAAAGIPSPRLGYALLQVTGDAGNVALDATLLNVQASVADYSFDQLPLQEISGDAASAAPGTPAFERFVANLRGYPNPFNPRTTIAYELRDPGAVRVRVIDARGRVVRTLLDGFQDRGTHELRWDGADDEGRPAAAGVYFGRVEGGGGAQVVKLALVK